jgi:aspartate racemase
LGVIGGLGPHASVYFYEKLTTLNKVGREQEHLDILLYSVPSTPDRTAFITGESAEDPGVKLIHAARTLENAGAEVLTVPCVTAHFFYGRIAEAVSVPVLHIVEETANRLNGKGIKRAGLLATEGTVKSRVFHEKLSEYGIETLTPSPGSQNALTGLIYESVKLGKPADKEEFRKLADELLERGAETVILGCTELSLVKRDHPEMSGESFADPIEILAGAAIGYCKGE